MGGQIYVFVSIGTHEARTPSKAANQNVSWSQKMRFPSCGTTSVINVKVFTESSPLVLVASKVAFAPCFPPPLIRHVHYAETRNSLRWRRFRPLGFSGIIGPCSRVHEGSLTSRGVDRTGHTHR